MSPARTREGAPAAARRPARRRSIAAIGVPAAVLAAVLVGGCGPAATGNDAGRTELHVAAAASLRVAATDLADAYSAARPGTTFVVATDSSAALRTQIEQGAPIDVFLSADTANPQALVDAGLGAGPPVPFAANALALVVPTANPAGIESPADLARPGVRVIAAGARVPITAYAERVVAALASLPGYPAGFAASVEANTVSREDNVAAALAKIELGEGDAAFVYATDAAVSAKVTTIPIPGAANVRASYAGVVVAASPRRDAAAAFLAWVAGPDGQAVLGRLGFLAP